MTHTPGPWVVGLELDGYPAERATWIRAQVGGRSKQIASTYNQTRASLQLSWDEAEANARLIAAAPELLEALEAVGVNRCWCAPYDKTDWRHVGEASDPDGHSPSCRRAQAAIAKARGQS